MYAVLEALSIKREHRKLLETSQRTRHLSLMNTMFQVLSRLKFLLKKLKGVKTSSKCDVDIE